MDAGGLGPLRAFVDPAANERDLGIGHALALGRHDPVFVEPRDIARHRACVGIARMDIGRRRIAAK